MKVRFGESIHYLLSSSRANCLQFARDWAGDHLKMGLRRNRFYPAPPNVFFPFFPIPKDFFPEPHMAREKNLSESGRREKNFRDRGPLIFRLIRHVLANVFMGLWRRVVMRFFPILVFFSDLLTPVSRKPLGSPWRVTLRAFFEGPET